MHNINHAYHSAPLFELDNMHLFAAHFCDWIGVRLPKIKTGIYLWETKVRMQNNRQEIYDVKFFRSK